MIFYLKKSQKKYKYDKHIDFDYEKASQEEIDKFEQFQIEYGEYLSTLDQYKFMSNQAKGKSKDLYFTSILSIGAILSIILGFLFSSMEHATSYYEFARTYPWTKKKDFLMKIGFGLIIIFSIIVFAISYSLIEKTKTENSGKMVLLKPIESLAKALVILSFSSIGTMIFQSSLFEGFSIMNFVVFGILIFVFTKIFNILFKLRLKV